MNTALKILGIIVLVALAITAVGLLAIYWAYALSVLWTWFLVPLGVKSIGVAHAYGISCIAGLILGTRGLKENTSNDDWITSVVQWVLLPSIALFFGWIAVGFM